MVYRLRMIGYGVNFLHAAVCPRQLHFPSINVSSPDVEALIRKHVSPVRPGRSMPRKMIAKHAVSFAYSKIFVL